MIIIAGNATLAPRTYRKKKKSNANAISRRAFVAFKLNSRSYCRTESFGSSEIGRRNKKTYVRKKGEETKRRPVFDRVTTRGGPKYDFRFRAILIIKISLAVATTSATGRGVRYTRGVGKWRGGEGEGQHGPPVYIIYTRREEGESLRSRGFPPFVGNRRRHHEERGID